MLPVLPIVSLTSIPATVVRKWQGTFIPRTYKRRRYKVYVPHHYRQDRPVPLILMLHGCTQDADDFALGTEMNRYADQYHFIAVYPEQPRSANRGRCWNWFRPEHQSRGSGEPSEIVAIVDQVRQDYTIDETRVYAVGISAGAAMAVILGATYPDVFAAIGVSSGVVYKASKSLLHSLKVLSDGVADPGTQGLAAYDAMGKHRRVMPVIVFHGTEDSTVAPRNGDQLITQWVQTNRLAYNGRGDSGIADRPSAVVKGRVPGGRTYTEYVYKDRSGKAILKKVMVDGMKHGWSGGSPDGSFTDPLGPKASQMIVEFLLDHALRYEPTVEIRRPSPVREVPRPEPVGAEPEPNWLERAGNAIRRFLRRE